MGTKDKGLIMKPNQEGMECWVDAAHASLNGTAKQHHQISKVLKNGIHYELCRMSLHASSKMPTEIALSTTEVEYIALSQSMREDVLPIIFG